MYFEYYLIFWLCLRATQLTILSFPTSPSKFGIHPIRWFIQTPAQFQEPATHPTGATLSQKKAAIPGTALLTTIPAIPHMRFPTQQ